MTTADTTKKANHIRQYCPGYVGGRDVANSASNTEILVLANLQDEHAKLQNRMKANRLDFANIVNAINAKTA